MKIKMFEYHQGAGVSAVLVRTGTTVNTLTPDEVYEVDAVLGAWLVDNRKGEQVSEEAKPAKTAHYGAQAEPELRDDEIMHRRMAEETKLEQDAELHGVEPEKKTKRSRK
jgi:hypothetical protein